MHFTFGRFSTCVMSLCDGCRMIESVSRRALGGSSGTYNVRASELARDRLKTLSATVVFLDDTQHCFQLEVNHIV